MQPFQEQHSPHQLFFYEPQRNFTTSPGYVLAHAVTHHKIEQDFPGKLVQLIYSSSFV